MSQASRRHALAPKRERLSVIEFIARADPDCGDGIVTHPPDRSRALHGLIGYDVPFNVAKVRAEAEMVRLYGKHAHRVKRRHDVDSRGRHRWASPVGDWADEAPGVPWPYMDGDDLALVRVAEAVLRAIDGQPNECMSCVAEDVSLDDVLETMVRLKLRQEQRRNTIYLQAKTWHRMHSTMVDEARTRTAADVLVAVASTVNVAIADPCPVCTGTRENRRGSLPDPEVNPSIRRKVCDGSSQRPSRDVPRELLTSTWTRQLIRSWERWREGRPGYGVFQTVGGRTMKTRAVARGEHRHHGAVPDAWQAWMDAEPGGEERKAALGLLISERRWDVWGDDGRSYHAEPRWLRGEMATLARRTLRIAWRDVRPVVFDLMSEVTEPMEAEG